MEPTTPNLARFLPPVEEGELLDRLETVVDPELGIDIVALGLVYEATVDAGVANIRMTTTSPACPIGSYLEDQVRWAILGPHGIPGVVDVAVELTHEPPWSPGRMTPEARRSLGWTG